MIGQLPVDSMQRVPPNDFGTLIHLSTPTNGHDGTVVINDAARISRQLGQMVSFLAPRTSIVFANSDA